jgi:hypothetical protein
MTKINPASHQWANSTRSGSAAMEKQTRPRPQWPAGEMGRTILVRKGGVNPLPRNYFNAAQKRWMRVQASRSASVLVA